MLIVGGRNDEECKRLNTPFLNDIHLFLLDQKSWIHVKYIPPSERLHRLGNHSMCVMTDGESYEKIFVFGGITHSRLAPVPTEAERQAKKAKKTAKIFSKRMIPTKQQQTTGPSRMSGALSPEEEGEKSDGLSRIPESSHLSNDLYCLEIRQIV